MRRLAPVALTPAAAFAVHQLRYWLAFGAHAGAALQQQGHSYLHSLVPWIVLLSPLRSARSCGAGTGLRRRMLHTPLHDLARRAVARLLGVPACDLCFAGVSRGPIRGRASGWAHGDLRLWRVVVDSGLARRRSRARGGVPRCALGAARSRAALRPRRRRARPPGTRRPRSSGTCWHRGSRRSPKAGLVAVPPVGCRSLKPSKPAATHPHSGRAHRSWLA